MFFYCLCCISYNLQGWHTPTLWLYWQLLFSTFCLLCTCYFARSVFALTILFQRIFWLTEHLDLLHACNNIILPPIRNAFFVLAHIALWHKKASYFHVCLLFQCHCALVIARHCEILLSWCELCPINEELPIKLNETLVTNNIYI